MPFIKLECVGCTDRKLSFNPVKKKNYSLMCSSSSSSYKPQYKIPSTFSILHHIPSKYITWSGRFLSLGDSTLILHQLHSTHLLRWQVFMCCYPWLY